VVHGLSIPALNLIYRYCDVKPIQEDAVELRRLSTHVPVPVNAAVGDDETFIAYNRFSRPVFDEADLPVFKEPDEESDSNSWPALAEKTRIERRYSRSRSCPPKRGSVV
jgi:hypothetical protein